ncbi:hypothetical protein NC651_023237 [Populus alba x Populus x berolinensis]|nr:hypothetical protein NC651_023234 [Populus alba x Populus x berolinensis]KAJ6897307.1 hypothetical protein NC651_023237 [Populus alba x Populus x berolinensis]
MGICWGSSAHSPITPSTTGHLSTAGISQTTSDTASSGVSNATSSRGSNISAHSRFSAGSGDEEFPNGQILPAPNLRIFSFAELKVATRNFKPDTLLGEGGFGQVYKGWLDEKAPGRIGSGTIIAVKRLKSESLQGFEEWQSEVNFLGRLSHPHLVRLIGYCWEVKELLLVYEFMQKGSLENHLFGRGSAVQPLLWDTRLKIAIGAARGLAFLHTSDKQVIYRDFKASNILLDGAYTAKLSDFGLAKLGPSASQSHVTTRVMGTYGYAAPEYVATGHLYVKSDLYGFGVVLVEILTGLRALDPNRPSERQTLVDWIKPYLSDKRKLKSIMDSHLEGRYPSKAAQQIAQLALNCLESEHKHRPHMKQVVETLERIEASKERQGQTRTRPNRSKSHQNRQQPSQYHSPLHPIPGRSRGYQHSPRVRKSFELAISRLSTYVFEVLLSGATNTTADRKELENLSRDSDDNEAQLIVLIENVTHGYTAAGFSGRKPCAKLADSIVWCGRSTLEKAISLVNANEKWKAKVICGDTYRHEMVAVPEIESDGVFTISDLKACVSSRDVCEGRLVIRGGFDGVLFAVNSDD